jgi:hypothetical protein
MPSGPKKRKAARRKKEKEKEKENNNININLSSTNNTLHGIYFVQYVIIIFLLRFMFVGDISDSRYI